LHQIEPPFLVSAARHTHRLVYDKQVELAEIYVYILADLPDLPTTATPLVPYSSTPEAGIRRHNTDLREEQLLGRLVRKTFKQIVQRIDRRVRSKQVNIRQGRRSSEFGDLTRHQSVDLDLGQLTTFKLPQPRSDTVREGAKTQRGPFYGRNVTRFEPEGSFNA
jgi:hypothetical protein